MGLKSSRARFMHNYKKKDDNGVTYVTHRSRAFEASKKFEWDDATNSNMIYDNSVSIYLV